MHLFTNEKGTVLEIKDLGYGKGKEALAYRKKLSKKLGKEVIAWAHMGGDNPDAKVRKLEN